MPNNYDYVADRKLFSQILMLKFLYPDNKRWNSKFVYVLNTLIEEYKDDIFFNHIGFPEDWRERIVNTN